jgi:translation initiation factor 5
MPILHEQPETDYRIKNGAIYHKCAACGAKEMVDMHHKLTNFILAQDKKDKKSKGKNKKEKKKGKDDSDDDKKDKKKGKDDSDDDKKKKKDKKAKKEKKSKKDKNQDDEDSNGDNKDYLKEAMFGKNQDDLGIVSDDDDDDDVASEAGVDDEGAMGKFGLGLHLRFEAMLADSCHYRPMLFTILCVP